MARRAKKEETFSVIARRYNNWYLNAWDKFTQMTPEEQAAWEMLKKTLEAPKINPQTRSRFRGIECVTTGEVFESVASAAKHFKMSLSTITRSASEGKYVQNKLFRFLMED